MHTDSLMIPIIYNSFYFSCGCFCLPALKHSHCARHLLSNTPIVISTPIEEKIELILITFQRHMVHFHGQRNVKNVLAWTSVCTFIDRPDGMTPAWMRRRHLSLPVLLSACLHIFYSDRLRN